MSSLILASISLMSRNEQRVALTELRCITQCMHMVKGMFNSYIRPASSTTPVHTSRKKWINLPYIVNLVSFLMKLVPLSILKKILTLVCLYLYAHQVTKRAEH